MNDRIKAMCYVLDMAREFDEDRVLESLLEKAKSIGITNHDKQTLWAAERQKEYLAGVHALLEEVDDAEAIPAEKAKLAIAIAEPFHIEGMMVLSTSHVSEKSVKYLQEKKYPLIVKDWSAEGAVVFVPPDQETWNEVASMALLSEIGDDVFACMEHARAHGCCWLLLDADGATAEGLAQFDW
jgi:hypothetical protein